MGEDFDNHRRIFDRGNDLQSSAAVRAVFDVDVEDPFGKNARVRLPKSTNLVTIRMFRLTFNEWPVDNRRRLEAGLRIESLHSDPSRSMSWTNI